MVYYIYANFFIVKSFDTNSSLSLQKHQLTISILLPGYNLPIESIFPITFCLLLVLTIHEIGHGICALIEGVHVYSMGIFLVGILPGAYVNIDHNVSKLPKRLFFVYLL
jgi:hypothetical protein